MNTNINIFNSSIYKNEIKNEELSILLEEYWKITKCYFQFHGYIEVICHITFKPLRFAHVILVQAAVVWSIPNPFIYIVNDKLYNFDRLIPICSAL